MIHNFLKCWFCVFLFIYFNQQEVTFKFLVTTVMRRDRTDISVLSHVLPRYFLDNYFQLLVTQVPIPMCYVHRVVWNYLFIY